MARIRTIPLRHDDVFYPESDGLPMGETELHRDEIVYLIDAFKKRFQADPNVYVGGNLFLYYRRGDPRRCHAPMSWSSRAFPSCRCTETFRLWEEGEAPCLVIEVRSDSTAGNDFNSKKALYEVSASKSTSSMIRSPSESPIDPGLSPRGRRALPIGGPGVGRLAGPAKRPA